MKKFCVLLFMICLWACSPTELESAEGQSTVTLSADKLIVFQDAINKFELKYSPDEYYPDTYTRPGEVFVLFLDVNKFFLGKNLEEVRLNVSVNPACISIQGYSPLTSDIKDVSINGVDFTKYSARDAGANTLTFEHITYQTEHAESCYEITISIREYVLDVFPDLTEYSKAVLDSKLEPVVQSFKFLD